VDIIYLNKLHVDQTGHHLPIFNSLIALSGLTQKL